MRVLLDENTSDRRLASRLQASGHSTEIYEIEGDFKAKVESEFDTMIAGLTETG